MNKEIEQKPQSSENKSRRWFLKVATLFSVVLGVGVAQVQKMMHEKTTTTRTQDLRPDPLPQPQPPALNVQIDQVTLHEFEQNYQEYIAYYK